ncbi:MAG: hypothetical protein LLG02_12860 [Pelosinus sp.]|nr:hypothetical protein [Pelosinus sp.]
MTKFYYWFIISLLGIGVGWFITGIDGAIFLALISIGSGLVQLFESKKRSSNS